MPEFKWNTRRDFLDRARQSNPTLRNLSDEEAYEQLISQFPEYQQQIAENLPQQQTLTDTYPGENEIIDDRTGPRKTVGTAFKEIFASKDSYTYLPFVRDLEVISLTKDLAAAKALERGEASEEQIQRIRDMVADDSMGRSFGYNVVTTIAESLAFMTELGALTFGNIASKFTPDFGADDMLARAATAKKVGSESAKKGLRKSLKAFGKDRLKTLLRTANKLGLDSAAKVAKGVAGDIGKTTGAKVAKKAVKDGWKDVRNNQFNKTLFKAAMGAKDKTLGTTIKANAEAAGQGVKEYVTKRGTKLMLGGAREVAILSGIRSPQAVKFALERMIPQYGMTPGIDDELMLEVLDDGEDFWPALVKGYADLGIEFFSERTGELMPLAYFGMGGGTLNKIGKGILDDSAKMSANGLRKLLGKEAGDNVVDAFKQLSASASGVKAAILTRVMKGNTAEEALEKLQSMGWNGVIGEMFEERVGDVMRATIGLQDNFLPSPEQLMTEAVAFTLTGGLMHSAQSIGQSRALGSIGAEKVQNLMRLVREGHENQIVAEEEVKKTVDEIIQIVKEKRENPNFFERHIANISVFGVKPFTMENRGIVGLMTQMGGVEFRANIVNALESGASNEEIYKAARKGAESFFNRSIYTVKNQEDVARARELLKDNLVPITEGERQLWAINPKNMKEKDIKEAVNIASSQAGVIVAPAGTILQLHNNGILDGTGFDALAFDAKKGTVEYTEAVNSMAKILYSSDEQHATRMYDALSLIMTSPIAQKMALSGTFTNPAIIRDTLKRVKERLNYPFLKGNDEDVREFMVGGLNRAGVINLSTLADIGDAYEEFLESIYRDNSSVDKRAIVEEIGSLISDIAADGGFQDQISNDTDAEIFVKTAIIRLAGIKHGAQSETYLNLKIDDKLLDQLDEMTGKLIGQKLWEDMKALVPGSGAELTVDEKTPTKEAVTEETKPKETPKSTAEAPVTAPESTNEGEDGSEATPVRDALKKVVSGEGKFKEVNKAIEASEHPAAPALKDVEIDITAENSSDVAQQLLDFMDSEGWHFSAHQTETMNANDAALIEAVMGYDQANRIIKELNRNVITHQMNINTNNPVTKGAEGMNQLIDIFEKSPKLVEDLRTAEGMERFILRTLPEGNGTILETLRSALAVLANQYSYEQLAAQWIGLSKIYKGSVRMSIGALKFAPDGTILLDHINGRNMAAFYVAQIAGYVSEMTKGNKQYELWSHLGTPQGIQELLGRMSRATGINKRVLRSIKPAMLERFYNDLMEVVRSQEYISFKGAEYRAKLIMTELSKKDGLIDQITKWSRFSSSNSAMYRDGDGNHTTSLRLPSPLTRVAKKVAADLGITPDQAIMMIDHKEGRYKKRKVGGKELLYDRMEAWEDVFFHALSVGDEFYYQSIGATGEKLHMYAYAARVYGQKNLKELISSYRSLLDKFSDKEKGMLTSMMEFRQLVAKASAFTGEGRNKALFKLNYIYNRTKTIHDLHGNLEGFEKDGKIDVNLVLKRASQIPTGGWLLEGRTVRTLVVNDVGKHFDGQQIFVTQFGRDVAAFSDPNGKGMETNIKASVYYVDPNTGYLIQLKGNAVNGDIIELDGYKNIMAWINKYNADNPKAQIDVIAFESSRKAGDKVAPASMIIEQGENGIMQVSKNAQINPESIIDVPGENYAIVQDLSRSTDPGIENISKQFLTDMIFMPNRERIMELRNQQAHVLRKMRKSIERISKLKANGQLSPEDFWDDMSQIIRGRDRYRYEVESRNKKGEIVKKMVVDNQDHQDLVADFQNFLRAVDWGREATKADMKALIVSMEEGFKGLENSPRFSRQIAQLKGIITNHITWQKANRSQSIKISAAGLQLPGYRQAENKETLLPWSVGNVAGIRTARIFTSEKDARFAMKHQMLDTNHSIDDLYYLDEQGRPNYSKPRYNEIYHDVEGKFSAKGSWIVPGGYLLESRIPAENAHSHAVTRLFNTVNGSENGNMLGNFLTGNLDIAMQKGEDLDGDTGFGMSLISNADSQLKRLHNQILLLEADNYSLAEIWDSLQIKVEPGILNRFVGTKYDTPAKEHKFNTPEFEQAAHIAVATSRDALGIVASRVRAFDLFRAAELRLKSELSFGLRSLELSPGSIELKLENSTKDTPGREMLHKVNYSTIPINVAVDDPSHRLMERLGLDEITLPIYQAFMALHGTFESQRERDKYEDAILGFINKDLKSYVKALRQYYSVNYKARKVVRDKEGFIDEAKTKELGEIFKKHGWDSKEHNAFAKENTIGEESKREFIRRNMKKAGVSNNQLKDLLKMTEIVDEFNVLARLMNVVYTAPSNAAELKMRMDEWERLKNNQFKYIDSSSLFKNGTHPEMIQLEMALQDYAENFKNSILLSPTFDEIIVPRLQKEMKWVLDNTEKMDNLEKNVLRAATIMSLTYDNLDNYSIKELSDYLAGRMVHYRAMARKKGVENAFAESIEYDDEFIRLSSFFEQNLPDEVIEAAQKGFAMMSEQDQRLFALYNAMVYGTSNWLGGGSFQSLIGTDMQRHIDETGAKIMQSMIQDPGALEGLLQNVMDEFIHTGGQKYVSIPDRWSVKRHDKRIGIAEEIINQERTSQNLHQDGYDYRRFKSLTGENLPDLKIYIDKNYTGDERAQLNELLRQVGVTGNIPLSISDIPGTLSLLLYMKQNEQEVVEELNEEQQTTVQQQKEKLQKLAEEIPGADISLPAHREMRSSRLSMHRMMNTTAFLSPLMMAGGHGLHRIWLNDFLKHESRRMLGLSYQRQLERMAGVRSGREESSITPEERELGDLALKAVAAYLERSEDVLTGFHERTLSVEEAVNILIPFIQQRVGDAKAAVTEHQKEELTALREKGHLASDQRVSNQGQAAKLILEGSLKARANEDGFVTIEIPVFDGRNPIEVLAEYDQERNKDKTVSSDKIIEAGRKMLENALRYHNENARYHNNIINQKNDYIPHYLNDRNLQWRESSAKKNQRSETGREIPREPADYRLSQQAKRGYISDTLDIGHMVERYYREEADNSLMLHSWGLLMSGAMPDGSPVMIPELDRKVVHSGKGIVSMAQVNALAEKLRNIGIEGATSFDVINNFVAQRNMDDFIKYETGNTTMPFVWARKDGTHKLVQMVVGQKRDSVPWNVWEALVNYTKFMAIGFPYMSYFHKFALLESAVGAIGIKPELGHFNFASHYRAFNQFRKGLEDNPELAPEWMAYGLKASDQHPDYLQSLVNTHLETAADFLEQHKLGLAGRSIRGFLNIKKGWDEKLWVKFHGPLKLWVAQGIYNKRIDMLKAEGKSYNDRVIRMDIANMVNEMFGGNNFQRFIWATPNTMQTLNATAFAFDWTYSAAGISGAANIPGLHGVFDSNKQFQNSFRYQVYWPAFLALVLFAIPNALQALIWLFSRPFGDDDLEPLAIFNENERRTYVDISPIAEAGKHIPIAGRIFGPDDGRRTYLRWGKQAYEIKGWVQHPIQTTGHKLSVPLKWAIEQASGKSVGGWDLAYKDADYFRVMSAHGSFLKSRIGDTLMRFTPFTVQDIIQGKPAVWFAKAKQGKHGWYASKQLTELYLGYVSDSQWKMTKDYKEKIESIGADILNAAEKNGFDRDQVHQAALQNARAMIYAKLETALAKNDYAKANLYGEQLQGLEARAWKIKQILSQRT